MTTPQFKALSIGDQIYNPFAGTENPATVVNTFYQGGHFHVWAEPKNGVKVGRLAAQLQITEREAAAVELMASAPQRPAYKAAPWVI